MNPGTAAALRIVIVVTSFAAAALIVALNLRGVRELPAGHRLTRASIVVVLLSIAYATLESAVRQVPGAPRLWVLASGLVCLTVGLIVTLFERRHR